MRKACKAKKKRPGKITKLLKMLRTTIQRDSKKIKIKERSKSGLNSDFIEISVYETFQRFEIHEKIFLFKTCTQLKKNNGIFH